MVIRPLVPHLELDLHLAPRLPGDPSAFSGRARPRRHCCIRPERIHFSTPS